MAEFRRKIQKICESVGIIRDVSGLIAQFVPTFGQEVERIFKSTIYSTEVVPANEELFATHEGLWFVELESVYHRQPSPPIPWQEYDKLVREFLSEMSDREISFLTPNHTPGLTVMRLLVQPSDLLNLTFKYVSSRDDAYKRLNERIILFLCDLQKYAYDDPYINGWAKDVVYIHRLSGRPYEALVKIILPHQTAINQRDETLFMRLLPWPKINLHFHQFWTQIRSRNDRNAIWRGLEDILDLTLDTQLVVQSTNY